MSLLTPETGKVTPPAAHPSEDCAPDWVAEGTPEPLRSGLIEALGADRVLSRALDLVRYASDASPYRQIPRAVVMPQSIEDVVRLMSFASRMQTPLTFRAGGSSLNGQAQTDSILVDARRHWQHASIEGAGRRARVQPGMILGHVNRLLARHGRKLGPDPASTNIACVGGVIANNSGGMRCGVAADSYQTVRSMTLVLANGAVIDTAAPGAEAQFALQAPELAAGLAEIRDELRADRELAARVRRKFEIKNTTGYRLCAFLDADSPLEIFRRLVIGSEGTLGFVAEAVFDTVPFARHAITAMLPFATVDAAAEAVAPMVDCGASATELMVAPLLIEAARHIDGVPERWTELPEESGALLVEFRADQPEALDELEHTALRLLEGRPLIEPPAFTREPGETRMLWRVRESLHALMAQIRPAGTQLILEDVCVPPARVAEAAKDLPALLRRHDFLPTVAGHASAGNLHFVLTPDFERAGDLERYEAFMSELVDLIVDKFDGSLKAEHGTGTNMAAFVEREWGAEATSMMWRVKRLADPLGILAPGVVLNRDPGAHLRNLKTMPEIEAVATQCIECGACEPACPSRNATTTPRQRIVLRREMARQPPGSPVLRALLAQYEYDAIQTCAADGSCGPACPVGIDTGELIKLLRRREHSERAERAALGVARRYGAAERAARGALRVGGAGARVLGDGGMAKASSLARELTSAEVVPAWSTSTPAPAPAHLPFTVRGGAVAVFVPSCVNRIFGRPRGEAGHPTVSEALVAISQRAGLPVWIPPDVAGHCCGTPWSSKGFEAGLALMSERMARALERWSDGGRLPVVLDASSCTYGLRDEVRPLGVQILDSVEWIHDHVLPRLEPVGKLGSVVVHQTCSGDHLGLGAKLEAIASKLAEEVTIPAAAGCCGMAGDRGWLHPELPASALRDVAHELQGCSFDACISSNRTCEAALQEVTGLPYRSVVLVLEELTRCVGEPPA